MRPAAAEWDEREQTPWPILQEAAKIGLYSLDFFATQFFEESGLGIPVAYEPLGQVGEQFAGHLDPVGEELAEQIGCEDGFGLAGWEPGWIRGRKGVLGEELGRAAGGGDASGGCALAL